jgi:hypothetical protein
MLRMSLKITSHGISAVVCGWRVGPAAIVGAIKIPKSMPEMSLLCCSGDDETAR